MRFMQKAPDGGINSGVTGFYLIELKSLFSIVLLKFELQENYERFHNHAFNALTLWLKGHIREDDINGTAHHYFGGEVKSTPRSKFHRVVPFGTAWAISVRGPWLNQWQEFRNNAFRTLTHGRKEI